MFKTKSIWLILAFLILATSCVFAALGATLPAIYIAIVAVFAVLVSLRE